MLNLQAVSSVEKKPPSICCMNVWLRSGADKQTQISRCSYSSTGVKTLAPWLIQQTIIQARLQAPNKPPNLNPTKPIHLDPEAQHILNPKPLYILNQQILDPQSQDFGLKRTWMRKAAWSVVEGTLHSFLSRLLKRHHYMRLVCGSATRACDSALRTHCYNFGVQG